MVERSPSQALRECHAASHVNRNDTTISLPLAPQALANFKVVKVEPTQITLAAENGTPVQIEYLEGCGFVIEVRHDLADASPTRQEFTGRQNSVNRSIMSLDSTAEGIRIVAGADECHVRRDTGAFKLLHNQATLISSGDATFLRNLEPVRVHERLESTSAVPNVRVYKPALDLGYFYSLGVTFNYDRPSGLILGLPGSTGEMNRNGYRFQLYNSDNSRHTPSRQPLYQSWPVLFHKSASGDAWVGVFHDNPSRTFVDIGELYPSSVRFESLTGNSRVYVVGGGSLQEVSSKMIALLGTPQRLPHFCFGYQQSRWSFFNAAEVHAAVQRFHENNVPLDSVYFDIDYMDHYRVFTVDKTAFHDLPGLISELHAQGIHSVSILDPGIKIDPGYAAFEELVQSDGALKTSQGEPFAAEAWAGASLLPDFYSARVQAWWRDKVSAWIRETNLDGIWNDMNEPTNWRGKNDTTAETVSAEGPMFERFNHYGLHMAAASDSGLHAAHPDRRHLNITRSGYPGVQQHAVIWHGDNAAWWEHMQMAVDMAVSYSLAGAFYTGPDVPGFAQNATDDLAVRFYQLGAFLPFFRGHRHLLSKPNEPFDFSPEANDLIKSAIHLRYSLLREWITGFEMAIQSGKSPLMPVFSPDNNLVRDQFMLFDTFLVCPVLARDQSARLIALPPGDWYRLGHPEERIAGGRYIVEPVSLSSVPVFVRAGKIITRNTVGRNAADTLDSPERYEVYPDAHGAAVGYWYDDDGRSSQFEPKRFFEIVVEGQRVQKKSSVIKSNP